MWLLSVALLIIASCCDDRKQILVPPLYDNNPISLKLGAQKEIK